MHTVVVMSSAQVGKALDVATPLPTPSGWTTMGEVAVGDVLFDERGEPCRVVAVSPIRADRDCYEVEFCDGERIIADGEHRWFVYLRSGKPAVVDTAHLFTLNEGKRGTASVARVPVCRPVQTPDAALPVDPYVLGVWLGDGNSASAVVTVDTRDGVLANLESALGRPLDVSCAQGEHVLQVHLGRSERTFEQACARGHAKRLYRGRWACAECSNLHQKAKRRGEKLEPVAAVRAGMHGQLSALGVIGNKHIPAQYLWASEAQRWALLQGLMDSDGTASERNSTVELTLTASALALDAASLMRSLGLKVRVSVADAKLRGRTVSQRWRLTATCYADQPVFRLARKQARLRQRDDPIARPTETSRRSVVAVRRVASVPVKCVAVDSPSRLYLAGPGFIPTHNTELLLNAIGYFLSQDPAPILLLQPTLEMAEAFSKDRLAPMLRDTPVLKYLVADPRSRDSGNTLLHKQSLNGARITMTGANAPASLAMRPVRLVMCDEVDRYPPSAGAEGDPVTLAKARAKTFFNRKLILTSTPTLKGHSRIEAAYQESDRRHYWVPCPHCGERQTLVWSQVRWEQGDAKSALYHCGHCGVGWTDAERYAAVRRGEWRAEAPFTGVAGFHLSELYSPWSRLTDIVYAFLDVKASRSAERMRAWQNTVLGECWEDAGETIDETGLMERAEAWDGEPEGVLFKTLGVDVQDDRLELELVGWGAGEESWSLRYDVIFGDPSAPTLWADLASYIEDWQPSATAVDTGGHYTQQAYAFCRNRLRQRVYAIKGMAGQGRPVWPKRASKNVGKVNLFLIGVDAAKEVVYSRLKIRTPGPGYCHFPRDRDDQYFAGLASEMVVTRYSKGFPVREWRKRKGGLRNEPLDCRVYAYAALCSFGTIHWHRLRKPAPVVKVEEVAPPVVVPRRIRRGGFVKSW